MSPFKITFRNRDDFTFEAFDDETILEASEDLGHILPYGCRYGGCITCAARLISGEVDQSEGVGLKPAQLRDGYVLMCVAHAASDCVFDVGVESHDTLYRNPFSNPDFKKITGGQG